MEREVISRVFFHLFPVIVAGTAMIMDLRNAKIDNGWILFSMFLGLMICIREKGISGVCFFVTGSSFPLFLIILFLFGMLGAGDIKLFCALGGVMGTGAVFRCILSSFLLGAVFSVLFLITTRSFCERIQYFITYMENCRNAGEIIPYRRKEITALENFHFTVPVFLSVMLYVGGIY